MAIHISTNHTESGKNMASTETANAVAPGKLRIVTRTLNSAELTADLALCAPLSPRYSKFETFTPNQRFTIGEFAAGTDKRRCSIIQLPWPSMLTEFAFIKQFRFCAGNLCTETRGKAGTAGTTEMLPSTKPRQHGQT